MTQENKELLLKDLCARLPYGVKIGFYASATKQTYICTLLGLEPQEDEPIIAKTENGSFYMLAGNVKPYLFPLSSMTEEQKEELKHEISKQTDILIERMKNDDCGIDCGKYHFHSLLELEWCIKNHFDYRGLIPLGLAIDATGLNIY